MAIFCNINFDKTFALFGVNFFYLKCWRCKICDIQKVCKIVLAQPAELYELIFFPLLTRKDSFMSNLHVVFRRLGNFGLCVPPFPIMLSSDNRASTDFMLQMLLTCRLQTTWPVLLRCSTFCWHCIDLCVYTMSQGERFKSLVLFGCILVFPLLVCVQFSTLPQICSQALT